MNNQNNERGRQRPPQQKQQFSAQPRPKTTEQARSASRGEAIRAQKRSVDDANRIVSQYKLPDQGESNGKKSQCHRRPP